MVAYLLDSDTLISSHRRYYPFDFCPGFWEWLELKYSQQRIFSVDVVYAELQKGGDELSHWAKSIKEKKFFLDTDDIRTVANIQKLTQWADASRYKPEAIHEFHNSADLVLIAYAKTFGFVLVTNEKSEPDSKKSVKIPDACKFLGLEYTDLLGLMRKENIRLILKNNDE